MSGTRKATMGADGRLERAKQQVGFLPGVAANLITLAEIVADLKGKTAGLALLDEAETAARDCDAHGILNWAAQARDELEARPES